PATRAPPTWGGSRRPGRPRPPCESSCGTGPSPGAPGDALASADRPAPTRARPPPPPPGRPPPPARPAGSSRAGSSVWRHFNPRPRRTQTARARGAPRGEAASRSAGPRPGGGAGRRRPRRVERRLGSVAQAVARELDEMVAHHGAVDQVLHAPGPQHPPRHPPEDAPVVAARAEPPEEPEEDRDAAPDARRSQARRIQGKAPPPPEGVALVIGVPRVEELRGVGRPNAPPPHLEHRLLGQPEPDVRLARGILEQPPLAGQPIPERRLRERVQDVDRQDRDLRGADELEDVVGRLGGVRV